MPRSLTCQIEKKLAKLNQLLNQIDEARILTEDPETWSSDLLYDLITNLKKTLNLLEDQTIKGQYDEFDQPLTEPGLTSLMDEYESEDEEDE
jgi:hypothetical protein